MQTLENVIASNFDNRSVAGQKRLIKRLFEWFELDVETPCNGNDFAQELLQCDPIACDGGVIDFIMRHRLASKNDVMTLVE